MKPQPHKDESGEFLWLVSLSDLMILLFIFFVVMFSAAYKKMQASDIEKVIYAMRNEKPPESTIDQLYAQIVALVKRERLEQMIQVNHLGDFLRVDIKDKVLFESGQFNLRTNGTQVLRRLATILEKVPEPYKIGIEGHTDDIPMHTKLIQDNWELSSKRALAVLYSFLLSPKTLKRTMLISHAEMEPLVPNRDAQGRPIPENQARNRRVTLRIF